MHSSQCTSTWSFANTMVLRTSQQHQQYSGSPPTSIYDPRSTAKQKSTQSKTYELTYHGYGTSFVYSSIPFREIPGSSRIAVSKPTGFILQPTRPFRTPSPHHTMGYCDHDRCQDPCCIQTQIRMYGFRDDLRHHEDQDKNGNMQDGDNVGGHGRR